MHKNFLKNENFSGLCPIILFFVLNVFFSFTSLTAKEVQANDENISVQIQNNITISKLASSTHNVNLLKDDYFPQIKIEQNFQTSDKKILLYLMKNFLDSGIKQINPNPSIYDIYNFNYILKSILLGYSDEFLQGFSEEEKNEIGELRAEILFNFGLFNDYIDLYTLSSNEKNEKLKLYYFLSLLSIGNYDEACQFFLESGFSIEQNKYKIFCFIHLKRKNEAELLLYSNDQISENEKLLLSNMLNNILEKEKVEINNIFELIICEYIRYTNYEIKNNKLNILTILANSENTDIKKRVELNYYLYAMSIISREEIISFFKTLALTKKENDIRLYPDEIVNLYLDEDKRKSFLSLFAFYNSDFAPVEFILVKKLFSNHIERLSLEYLTKDNEVNLQQNNPFEQNDNNLVSDEIIVHPFVILSLILDDRKLANDLYKSLMENKEKNNLQNLQIFTDYYENGNIKLIDENLSFNSIDLFYLLDNIKNNNQLICSYFWFKFYQEGNKQNLIQDICLSMTDNNIYKILKNFPHNEFMEFENISYKRKDIIPFEKPNK